MRFMEGVGIHMSANGPRVGDNYSTNVAAPDSPRKELMMMKPLAMGNLKKRRI